MMRRWVTRVVGHPWMVIGAVACVTLGFASRTGELRSEIRIARLLPQQHPYVRIHNKVEKEFGGGSVVVLAVVPKTGDIWQPSVLAKVKAITDDVLRLPGVISPNVTSPSAPAVRTFADRNGRIDIDYLMREVPSSESEVAELRKRVEDLWLFRGLLVSDDQRAALVMADFWAGQHEHHISAAIEGVAKNRSDDHIDVFWAGARETSAPTLPTITPHISGLSSSVDPLRSYFQALDRVANIVGIGTVLPAHGRPFRDLRARVRAIKHHHQERLERLRVLGRDLGPATVQEFSCHLFPLRSWGWMAESETYAHLEHLRLAGQAERYSGRLGRAVYRTA